MRVCTHGLYPYKMGCWVRGMEISLSRAFDAYIETCERINASLPVKERKRPEVTKAEKFDDGFINNGFRIISCGGVVTAIYKHDFKYTLIVANEKEFNAAWRVHYSGRPQRIANY